MKYLRLLTVTCLLQFTGTCIAAEPDGFTETRRPLNQVVAIVNDGVIVSSELGDPELERKLVLRVKQFRFEARDVEPITTTKPIDFFPA